MMHTGDSSMLTVAAPGNVYSKFNKYLLLLLLLSSSSSSVVVVVVVVVPVSIIDI
jgi:hypothetical protein